VAGLMMMVRRRRLGRAYRRRPRARRGRPSVRQGRFDAEPQAPGPPAPATGKLDLSEIAGALGLRPVCAQLQLTVAHQAAGGTRPDLDHGGRGHAQRALGGAAGELGAQLLDPVDGPAAGLGGGPARRARAWRFLRHGDRLVAPPRPPRNRQRPLPACDRMTPVFGDRAAALRACRLVFIARQQNSGACFQCEVCAKHSGSTTVMPSKRGR